MIKNLAKAMAYWSAFFCFASAMLFLIALSFDATDRSLRFYAAGTLAFGVASRIFAFVGGIK